MPYTPDTWANNDPTKPLNAARLTKLAGQYPQVMEDLPAKIADSGDPIGAALNGTIGSVAASDMANPESDLNSATLVVVEEALGGGAGNLLRIEKATLTDLSTARPPGAGMVLWFINEGDPNPVNFADGDAIFEVAEEAIAWTPMMLTGLAGWYSVDSHSALSDGAAVTAWPDLSGNARDLSVTTGSPTYAATGMNGTPGVSFTSDLMSSAAFTAVGAGVPLTIFASIKNTDPGSATVTMTDGQVDGTVPSNGTFQLYKSSSNKWGHRRAGSAYVSTANADTNPHVWHVIMDSNGATDPKGVWIDGVNVISSGVGVGTAISQIAFGGRLGATPQLSQTVIGDFFWKVGRATDQEIIDALAYLETKTGIAVA